jgi:hypothetical protein
VLDLELERTIRIERNDLNRWFLEQTSSPSLIPEIGAILVTPYNETLLYNFDALARGIVTAHSDDDMHEEAGNYFPDIIHLMKLDSDRLISGWDISGSLQNLITLQTFLDERIFGIGPRVFLDNSTRVLLERMNETAQRVGLISLLIALPLIWVGWILMGNLSGMLLLNERRKFGLMRLRGASGRTMGRALQISIGSGALLGGMLGAVAATLYPDDVHFHRRSCCADGQSQAGQICVHNIAAGGLWPRGQVRDRSGQCTLWLDRPACTGTR